MAILRAELRLPIPGYWFIRPGAVAADAPLGEVFLDTSDATDVLLSGRRTAEKDEQEEIRRSGWPLSGLYRRVQLHTKEHDDKQPQSLEDVKQEWSGSNDEKLSDDYHILFDVKITREDSGAPRVTEENAAVFAFEIAPPVNDRKHWVLLADGRTERREIDEELFAKHDVTLKPGRTPWAQLKVRELKEADYMVYARIRGEGAVELEVENSLTGDKAKVRIDPSGAVTGDREMLAKWATLRMWSMPLHRQATDSTILPYWWKQAPDLYGVERDELSFLAPPRRRRGASSDVFGVLGGRAAIRETLQVQAIDAGVPPPVPVAKSWPGGRGSGGRREAGWFTRADLRDQGCRGEVPPVRGDAR